MRKRRPSVDRCHPVAHVTPSRFLTASTLCSTHGLQVYCNLLPARVRHASPILQNRSSEHWNRETHTSKETVGESHCCVQHRLATLMQPGTEVPEKTLSIHPPSRKRLAAVPTKPHSSPTVRKQLSMGGARGESVGELRSIGQHHQSPKRPTSYRPSRRMPPSARTCRSALDCVEATRVTQPDRQADRVHPPAHAEAIAGRYGHPLWVQHHRSEAEHRVGTRSGGLDKSNSPSRRCVTKSVN